MKKSNLDLFMPPTIAGGIKTLMQSWSAGVCKQMDYLLRAEAIKKKKQAAKLDLKHSYKSKYLTQRRKNRWRKRERRKTGWKDKTLVQHKDR